MGYGVFIHRADSIYGDKPDERYPFPRQYLGRVQACIGSWILYYEPRKVVETRGYFAIAKVAQVIADPQNAGMFEALMEPGSYLEFANPVPFSHADGIVERGLLNEAGRISGRAQSAVRPISAADFNRILALELDELDRELPRVDGPPLVPPVLTADGFGEDAQTPFLFEQVRDRVVQLTSRLLRDRLFRRLVLKAYDKRCAITGLKLINGGGRAEVDAAHIRPVEANGPDSLSNGIALSGTAHWMFDRGLIALSNDLEIMISRQANDPQSIEGLINRTGKAIVPARGFERPYPAFLKWHRDHCFKH